MNPHVVAVKDLIPFAFNAHDVPIISHALEQDPDAIERIVKSVFDDGTIRPFDRLTEVKKIFKKEPYNLTNWKTDANCRYIYAVMLLLQNERSPNEGTTREMVCITN